MFERSKTNVILQFFFFLGPFTMCLNFFLNVDTFFNSFRHYLKKTNKQTKKTKKLPALKLILSKVLLHALLLHA